MSSRSLRKFLSGGTVTAVCLVSMLVNAARGEPPKLIATPERIPAPGWSYTGTKGCVACHRLESESWGKTKHVHAFTDRPTQYRSDPACLACHVTGYGKWGGYVAGTSAAILDDLLEVGCEACHGPGSRHEKLAKEFAESKTFDDKLEQQMRASIYEIRPDNACVVCHVSPQGHKIHPTCQGQASRTSFVNRAATSGCWHSTPTVGPLGFAKMPQPATPPGQCYTGVKPCASCHYQQYRAWRTDKHAVALIDMPIKYWADREYLQCHITGYGAPGGYTEGANPAVLGNLLDVTCEACHGPGGGHVRFNKQFIDCPPLGLELKRVARHTISKILPGNACA
jgi:hypothetical protein